MKARLTPASALQGFSNAEQVSTKKLILPVSDLPERVGYSSGAALVYAVFAQAPPDAFS
jgi:hypothetical protein